VKTSAKVLLTGKDLTLSDLVMVALFNKPMEIKISAAVDESEKLLNDKLAQNYFLYGVNTNFGKDVSLLVQPEQMEELQRNLIRSLLCGASISDELLPMPIIKGAMLARINCLLLGYSGVSRTLILKKAEALKLGLIPLVPLFGSVGASGDLIPSAYIANFIFGGFADDTLSCYTPSGIMPLPQAYFKFGFEPLYKIRPKECLSIINSVSFCVSIASLAIFELKKVVELLALIASFSAQAVRCFDEDFSPYVQELRSGPESGAVKFAEKVCQLNHPNPLLLDAEKARRGNRRNIPLQDAYSLGRCASQHLDSLLDVLKISEEKINTVLNRAHDNPLIDPHKQRISHSGNFYAGDIASRMDWTRVEIGKAAKWLHAIVNRLLDENKNNGLGANLVYRQDGIQNGLKGLNLLSTALTTPLSGVTAISPLTVPTERENQDIVSLAFQSAIETYRAVGILENLVAVSLICALQAFDLRLKKEQISVSRKKFNPMLVNAYQQFRDIVPFVKKDVSFHAYIQKLKIFIQKQERIL